ncbi:EH signature domain-containing protein [Legionella jordanis]|uniref:Zorya protein ZorC EH domain-containing protein n=1 Tax=Legionella jordanis TaxID=456 RepID=A0A0W0VFE6_9GAMM|nr:EH signature domain-containing protein [Legionella jordanis]KTD18862.1 hypothetical protein Ljor_0085 [Legionella jordanis]RMX05567.1 hypothetical protein EAW55_02660 [Legionella jordanis]VEH12962.1 Uncharacterised protein [Legionella jordanis]
MQSDNSPSLRKEISQFYHTIKLKSQHLSLQEPQVNRALKIIEKKFDSLGSIPTSQNLEKLSITFYKALEAKSFDNISNKEWKLVPFILWTTPQVNSFALGSDLNFLQKYLNWLSQNLTASNLKKLIYCFLKDFSLREQYLAVFKKLSCFITEKIYSSMNPSLSKWYERNQKLNIFSPNFDLSKVISLYLNECNLDIYKFFSLLGLQGEISIRGYSEAIGLNLLKILEREPSDKLINAVINYFFSKDSVRFSNHRVNLIQSLLTPWLSNNSTNSSESQKKVQDLLIKHFKDPRIIAYRRDGWRSISEQYLKVIYQWLVGESIEQFFEIVDQMALDRQWKYRKAFWMAYYKYGFLDEAWFVLGPDAKYYAETYFENKLSFGAMDSGCKSNHSVLILKIGNIVLAEWSHEGKCRAWRDEDPKAPERYKNYYVGKNFKEESLKIVPHYNSDGIGHLSSNTYSWQQNLSDFIYRNTGLKVYHSDFWI